ncbi:YycH family regulatory protein [Gracilibacillus alcaliphilus]|uniref:YycH family regulatory protein n=1 Tax=Gracilibacillus alcaliphilus TaxID=1401441 RepID=UPI00195AA1D4|nr:two-component system activity regulator YycH [Gracilibacillus alcaliphilus]MBM7678691.1 regulatory protein YycH of two-component signal transduction system YycFG [Gracilibacillus alcaliphilus]
MKFNIEFLKTILLVFLVGLSLLLTLGLWTYQGDYETASRDLAAEAQLDGTDATKRDLIQPSQLIIHDGDAPFGFVDKHVEQDIFTELTTWNLYDFQIMSEETAFQKENYNQVIEIVFPASMPFSLINEIFSTDDTMRFDGKFKRVYIILDEEQTDHQIIFDDGNPDGIDIWAGVHNMNQIIDFFAEKRDNHSLTEYLTKTIYSDRTVYIPEETDIQGRKYRYETINASSTNFLNIFFRNPSSIASSPNDESGQVFSDGQREVNVNGYAMEYNNFSIPDSQTDLEDDIEGSYADYLLNNSVEYINSHNGWLVEQDMNYRLSRLNDVTSSVEFRLIHENYPIFSSQGLSSMSVTYQNQNVYQYNRPLMKLTLSYDRAPTDLMTGKQLVKYLDQSDQFNWEDILDIQIGYKLEQQPGGQIFDLIPTWCIETYSGWEYVTRETKPVNQGGNPNAVGSN